MLKAPQRFKQFYYTSSKLTRSISTKGNDLRKVLEAPPSFKDVHGVIIPQNSLFYLENIMKEINNKKPDPIINATLKKLSKGPIPISTVLGITKFLKNHN